MAAPCAGAGAAVCVCACVTEDPVQAAVGPGRRRTFPVHWVLPPGQRRPCPPVELLVWWAEHVLCFNLSVLRHLVFACHE